MIPGKICNYARNILEKLNISIDEIGEIYLTEKPIKNQYHHPAYQSKYPNPTQAYQMSLVYNYSRTTLTHDTSLRMRTPNTRMMTISSSSHLILMKKTQTTTSLILMSLIKTITRPVMMLDKCC